MVSCESLYNYNIYSNYYFLMQLFSYNKLRNNSREIEFQLVQEEIEQIDELIKKGEYSLNWNSEGKVIVFKY